MQSHAAMSIFLTYSHGALTTGHAVFLLSNCQPYVTSVQIFILQMPSMHIPNMNVVWIYIVCLFATRQVTDSGG